MTKYIHIHAKCNFFEIFEEIAEYKSAKRLKEIKEMFLHEKRRRGIATRMPKKVIRAFDSVEVLIQEKLTVKTKLINPTLFPL